MHHRPEADKGPPSSCRGRDIGGECVPAGGRRQVSMRREKHGGSELREGVSCRPEAGARVSLPQRGEACGSGEMSVTADWPRSKDSSPKGEHDYSQVYERA